MKKKKITKQLQLELEQCDRVINTLMYKDDGLLKKTVKQIIKDVKK